MSREESVFDFHFIKREKSLQGSEHLKSGLARFGVKFSKTRPKKLGTNSSHTEVEIILETDPEDVRVLGNKHELEANWGRRCLVTNPFFKEWFFIGSFSRFLCPLF